MVVDLGVSEEAPLFPQLDEVLQPRPARFGVLGLQFRAAQEFPLGVAVAARAPGTAQFHELLRLDLELLFLLLGKEHRLLRLRLFQRGELSRFRLLAGGKFPRLRFFARDALALPLFFFRSLQAHLLLGGALARLLQLRRLARAFLLPGGLESGALLLSCGFRAGRVLRPAGFFLFPFARDPGTGGFIRLEPADPLSFPFPRRPGTRRFAGLARLLALLLGAQARGGLRPLRLELRHQQAFLPGERELGRGAGPGQNARFRLNFLFRHDFAVSHEIAREPEIIALFEALAGVCLRSRSKRRISASSSGVRPGFTLRASNRCCRCLSCRHSRAPRKSTSMCSASSFVSRSAAWLDSRRLRNSVPWKWSTTIFPSVSGFSRQNSATATRARASGELWSSSSGESSFASAGLEIRHWSKIRTNLSSGACAPRSNPRAGAGLAP